MLSRYHTHKVLDGMVLPRQSVVKSVESRLVLEDLKMGLEKAGTSFDNVVMVYAFLSRSQLKTYPQRRKF